MSSPKLSRPIFKLGFWTLTVTTRLGFFCCSMSLSVAKDAMAASAAGGALGTGVEDKGVGVLDKAVAGGGLWTSAGTGAGAVTGVGTGTGAGVG